MKKKSERNPENETRPKNHKQDYYQLTRLNYYILLSINISSHAIEFYFQYVGKGNFHTLSTDEWTITKYISSFHFQLLHKTCNNKKQKNILIIGPSIAHCRKRMYWFVIMNICHITN